MLAVEVEGEEDLPQQTVEGVGRGLEVLHWVDQASQTAQQHPEVLQCGTVVLARDPQVCRGGGKMVQASSWHVPSLYLTPACTHRPRA